MTTELPTIQGDGPAPADATSYEAPPPRPQLPGRRGMGGTVEMSDGVATFVDHRTSSPAVFVPSQAPAPKAFSTDPLKFTTDGGQTILGRDAQMHDVVDLGGMIGETSIGAAVHNGWLVEAPGGGYERAGEAAPPKPASRPAKTPEPALETDTKPTDQQPEAPAPERNYLDHADEAALRDAETQIGGDTFAAVEAVLQDLDLEQVPDNLLSTIGAKLGVDRDQALAAVHEHAAPLVRQAANVIEAAVGPGTAQEVLAWGRSDPRGREVLRQAMRGQVDSRSTAGYQQLAAAWLTNEARTNPARVVQGLIAGGVDATVKGGRVMIDLGKEGEVELASALRGGVISIGQPRRR